MYTHGSAHRPNAATPLLLGVLAVLALVSGATGCARPTPEGLVPGTPPSATPAGGSAPSGGTDETSQATTEGVPIGPRPLFRAYYYPHQDGDQAVYRVLGNMHEKRKMVISYRWRVLKLLDGQRARVLEVRRDFGDGKSRATFLLTDEASGTTREVGFAEQGKAAVIYFDPPPLTLLWGKAAHKGFELQIPRRPVTAVDDKRVSAGDMKVDVFEALGVESVTVRDTAGKQIKYARALKWRTTMDDGGELIQWWGHNGEIVRETYRKGQDLERRDLVRVLRR